MSTKLDAQVREALMARKGDWQAVAVGADISHSWLSKFANGHIVNPGYATLTRLRMFLKTGKAQPRVRPAEEQSEAAPTEAAQG